VHLSPQEEMMPSLNAPGGRVAVRQISIDFKLFERKASSKSPDSSDIVVSESLSSLFHLTQETTQINMQILWVADRDLMTDMKRLPVVSQSLT
jgi:hypothetical protein